MADAPRTRGPASKPVRGAHARKIKATAAPSSARNQEPSSPVSTTLASTSTILPRIDRRGADAPGSKYGDVAATRLAASTQERDGTTVSVPAPVPTPPLRPSIKATSVASMESSPTYQRDSLDGPSAKAAWCTPRSPTPTDVDRPHLAAFFATPGESDGGDSSSSALATPARLRSIEEKLAATDALYEVDLDKLQADNDKFFEISTSAQQHVDAMQIELPALTDSFQDTKSALKDLCGDIATLYQQHEEAKQRMLDQMTSAVDANADELVALTQVHATEKAQLTQKHLQEMQDACASFDTTVGALEQKLCDTEASYQEQLARLRESSDAQLQQLQASTQAELRSSKETAQAELEALEKLSTLKLAALETSSREELARREKELLGQLDALRASSTAAYEALQTTTSANYAELKERADAELTGLQHSSQEELTRVRTMLTKELETLRSDSASEMSALKSKTAQELHDLQRQKEEELASLRSSLTSERERISRDAKEERARVIKLREEQLSQLEGCRARETAALSAELEQARSSHAKEVANLHLQYKTRIQAMEDSYTTESSEIKASHIAQTNDIVRKAEANLSETVARYEERIRSMSESHDTEMKRTTQHAVLDREALVAKYERQTSEAEEDRRREREALVLGYETELEALKRSAREQIDSSVKAHKAYVGQLRESHAAKVLTLEASLRDQGAQLTEKLSAKSLELEKCEERALALEVSREALQVDFRQFSERSSETLARKEMDISEQEVLALRLDQLLQKTQGLLDESQRRLKFADDDRQVKAGTILELTFIIKSRDEEVDRLRNSLLDTVKTVNTKTEILEMTAETLSSKAKELEDTRAALRLESGRLTMVEESMHQKEGMLEDTTLKVESMRLNMENMRLEMKRMQMDMKLQLEHAEGEMELKNGEIRRLHSSVNELKLKHDFSQQTVERLEESLGVANRQVDEAQRRINLLKLEASNNADELKKTGDLLCEKESALLVANLEKQAVASEKNRLHIQLNNLSLLSQRLREEAERNAMGADDTQTRYRRTLEKVITEKDERLGAEKHLLTLELNAAKDMVRYLEGVEERYKLTSTELEAHKSQRTALEIELSALRDTATRLEEELQASQLKIRDQSSTITELTDAAEASETQFSTQLEAERRRASDYQAAVDEAHEKLEQSSSLAEMLEREKKLLHDDLARATRDHEFLQASINEEKSSIFETMASLKKDLGDREEELQQVRSQRALLQGLSERTQSELDQASAELKGVRAELVSRSEECGQLCERIQELEATCSDVNAKRSQETAIYADACSGFEATIANQADELVVRSLQLAESREQAQLLREDCLGALRDASERAETADSAYKQELKRIEEAKAESLQRMEEATAATMQHMKDETDGALQHIHTEKEEMMRLADEEKRELLRVAEEEKLTILRQAEEEKAEILLERQVRESASRTHRTQERERLRRLAKYEQERLLELNESAQMLAEEQQTRLLAELHRTKDENANLLVEHCLTEAAAKLQLVYEQEELRKIAHDERICLLELNESSRMVAEEQRVRLFDKEMERQRLMDEEQTARLLELHAREQMAKEEEYVALLERHEHDQVAISKQRERFSEQHERFVMWNAEHETRLFESHLADVEALQDSHALEQTKLASELAEVKRVLDERAAKAEADQREWERIHVSTLINTAERHQVELDTSIRSVREEESGKLREKHQAELEALAKEFDQKAEVIRLRTAQEHLVKINEMLERSRMEEQKHVSVVDSYKQELETRNEELMEAVRQLEERDRAMCEMEMTLNTKRFDTEAQLNANLLELEVHRDATQQELEIQLSATEIALAEANEVVVAKSAAIESLRKELSIVLEASKGTRSAEQLVSLLRQQVETFLLEEHRINVTELPKIQLDGEQDVLDCMKGYFAMLCRPRSGTSQESAPPVLFSIDDVRVRLREHDRICAMLQGDVPPTDALASTAGGTISEEVKALQSNLTLLRSSIQGLLAGSSDDSCSDASPNISALVEQVGSLRGFFDKLRLSSANDSERSIRQAEVIEVLAQHERLMQTVSTSSERDEVHTIDDVCAHFDWLEKMLVRAREVTESNEFRCLADFQRILDECELHRRQVDEFRQGVLTCCDSIRDESSSNLPRATNYVGASDVATLLCEYKAFVSNCWSALELNESQLDDSQSSKAMILEGIHDLMSILRHFEALQPQLGSPRRRDGDASEMIASSEKPSLHNKVTAIVSFADELKNMSEFAQSILDEECEAGNQCDASSNMSSTSLASLRSLTRTPTPSRELMGHGDLESDADCTAPVDDELELSIAIETTDDPDLNLQDGNEGELEAMPALSASPSAFMADSLIDISLVMSDHQRLLAETAHLVEKASRQADGSRRPVDIGSEISRLVQEHCALLALTRRLFKVQDARRDLPSLLECVAILQRFTQRLPLLGLQPSASAESNSNNSSASLSSVPQALPSSQELAHSSSTSSNFAETHNAESVVAFNSTASLGASEPTIRSSLSIFVTLEEVARHLQDYDYLVQQLKKEHKGELPSSAFANVESLSSALSDNLGALALSQQALGIENAVSGIPQVAGAVQDILQQTRHLVLQPTATDIERSNVNVGVEGILRQFEDIVATLTEFSGLLAWLRATILQMPVPSADEANEDAPEPMSVIDAASISDLKQHVRDFVTQLCDFQAANHELEQELGAIKLAQEQMLHELRTESDMLSRLDTTAVDTSSTEPTSPQRRRADVLETLLTKQEAFRRQSSFQGREQQREIAFLREQGLLVVDPSDTEGGSDDGGKTGISSTTRLAIYKRLVEDRHLLERQLQHAKQDMAVSVSRHEAEMQEFHRQAELVRHGDRVAAEEQIAALKQALAVESGKVGQVEAQALEDKQALERQISELTQQEQEAASRHAQEMNEIQIQMLTLEQSLQDSNARSAAVEQTLSDAKARAYTDISTLKQALDDAKASMDMLEQSQQEQKATFEQQLSNWKLKAQAALDEEMAYLRRSDSLAFAASKLQCFSDGSISDKDEERGYSRLNVWRALVLHIDRLSDRLAAAEQRDVDEYDFLRSSGLIDGSPSGDAPVITAVRALLFQELLALRDREELQRRELEDEAAFIRAEVKMEFDEAEPSGSRQRVYKALLDGQSALIDDKMERELEAAQDMAYLEAHSLRFVDRRDALEYLVKVCEQLEQVKKQVDEERDLLVEQRICTPQELRRPLRSQDGEPCDTATEAEGQEGDSTSLGEFASIRLDVYRKLMANEQRSRDALQAQRQEHEEALAVAKDELQRQHQAEISSTMHTIEQLEHAIMAREDVMSGLDDRLEKHQAVENVVQRLQFDVEKQDEMAEALARWSEQSEAAIAAATAMATANAATLVEDKHKQEMECVKRGCGERIAALSDAHAKQLALVSAVRADSEAQTQQQVDESVANQVAKMRASLLERLAKRDGAAVATIYKCIRLATDVLNPSAYVTSSTASTTDASAAPPSRHGPTSTSGNGNGSDKIPVAVTHSVVALVKELKALKEHVATSLDQLQAGDADNSRHESDPGPPLSISSSFLLGDTAKPDSSAITEDNGTAWTEDNDRVADAILCAYREVMQYATRQLLTRQQAANDALARLYTLVLSEESAAASHSADSHVAKIEEELAQQRGARSPRLVLEIELARERTAREDAEMKHRLHDVCVRRLLEDQRSMETALSKALEASQLESKQLQTRVEQLEHYQRLALTSGNGFQSSPNAARTVTPTRGFGVGGSTSNMAMPTRPERPRDHPQFSTKGGGTTHKERFVSDLEKETGQRRTTDNSNAGAYNSGDGGSAIRRRRPLPAGEMDTSSLALSSRPATAARGSLHDQELWFQGVRTLHFVSFFVSVFFVPKQGVFRVEVLNSDTEQQQTVYVTRAEMQQFVAERERDKRRRSGHTEGFGVDQSDDARIDDPARRADVVDALFDHVKVYGEGSGNMLLAFE